MALLGDEAARVVHHHRADVFHFDVAMVRQDCYQRRQGLGPVPVDKTIDFWTHCKVWTTFVVDILPYTNGNQFQQWLS